MRKTSFRNKKTTTRITPISRKQIENLRTTRLKKATTYAEKKFLSSKSFERKIRQDIRSNRFKTNINRLDRIISKVGTTKDTELALLQLFGEKTKVTAEGIRRTNTFTSQKQTARLKRAEKLVDSGKFNIKRYAFRNEQYKKNKKFLPTNPSTSQILKAVVRNEFYYENKKDIVKFNSIASRKGRLHASNTRLGIKLANAHADFTNEETDEIFGAIIKGKV